jgi:hypothetical protein
VEAPARSRPSQNSELGVTKVDRENVNDRDDHPHWAEVNRVRTLDTVFSERIVRMAKRPVSVNSIFTVEPKSHMSIICAFASVPIATCSISARGIRGHRHGWSLPARRDPRARLGARRPLSKPSARVFPSTESEGIGASDADMGGRSPAAQVYK